jgi:hypothetical protein
MFLNLWKYSWLHIPVSIFWKSKNNVVLDNKNVLKYLTNQNGDKNIRNNFLKSNKSMLINFLNYLLSNFYIINLLVKIFTKRF